MEKVKAIIVDDHFLVRVGLRNTLTSSGFGVDVEVVAEAASMAEFYDLLASGVDADIVLLDILLPDGSGLDIARRLCDERPDLKILILSAESSDEVIEQMMSINIGGFISKGVTTAELSRAIDSVMDDVKYYGKDIARLMHSVKVSKSALCESNFTDKELEVLRLAAQGAYAKEIADKMGISPKTVSVHKNRIFKKLGINNSVELVHYALKMGFIKG